MAKTVKAKRKKPAEQPVKAQETPQVDDTQVIALTEDDALPIIDESESSSDGYHLFMELEQTDDEMVELETAADEAIMRTCPECKGKGIYEKLGGVFSGTCVECEGTGTVSQEVAQQIIQAQHEAKDKKETARAIVEEAKARAIRAIPRREEPQEVLDAADATPAGID